MPSHPPLDKVSATAEAVALLDEIIADHDGRRPNNGAGHLPEGPALAASPKRWPTTGEAMLLSQYRRHGKFHFRLPARDRRSIRPLPRAQPLGAATRSST